MAGDQTKARHTGGCQCGAVRYEVRGALRPVIACHCDQCRRMTGHFMAATAARRAHLTVVNDATLRWYAASDRARRGFCGACGSTLFWEAKGSSDVSIAAGNLDKPTGIRLAQHIFTAEKGDYYAIEDGVPQSQDGTCAIALPE